MRRVLSKLMPSALLLLIVSLLALFVFAAEISLLEGKITVSGDASQNNGKISVTASASAKGTATKMLTLKNTSGSKAQISFDWSAYVTNRTSSDYCEIDGNKTTFARSYTDYGDTYTVTLPIDGTISITLYTKGGSYFGNTGKLTLSNFTCTPISDSYNVTIAVEGNGTITLDGDSVTSGSIYAVEPSGSTLIATPNSGSTFLGWVDGNNALMSTSASYTIKPIADMSVKAVFGSSSTAWFMAGRTDGQRYLYNNLTNACAKAATLSDKTVVLLNNGTLTGSHTIPAGVTLLIPYNDSYEIRTTSPATTNSSYAKPTVFRQLSMASGASIVVNGAISLPGTQNANYQNNGQPHGPVGVISMNDDSSITINGGGFLYVWGYIAGSGSVTVESGGTVYEDFQIRDYRGGNVTLQLTNDSGKSKRMFPMSQYYVQNVQVPMTLKAGAIENGYMSVTYSILIDSVIKGASVPFIGNSDSMFQITEGHIIKDYDESTDRLMINVDGTLKLNPYSISIKVTSSGTANIQSKDYDLPINSNITVNLLNDSVLDINQSILLMPGSAISIGEKATLNVNNGQRLIVYDQDQWGLYCSDLNKDVVPLAYVYRDGTLKAPAYTRGTKDLVDAQILVNGTLDASAGYLYTTEGGGNICSDGAGQVIIQKNTAAIAYQAVQKENGDDDLVDSEWDAHDITSAQLLNGNETAGKYTTTIESNATTDEPDTYTYYASTGRWDKPSHFYDETAPVVTAPTCTKVGYTTHTCAVCGDTYTDEEQAALDHIDPNNDLKCDHCSTPLVKLAAIEASADAETELRLKFLVHEELVSTATAHVSFREEEEQTVALSSLTPDPKGRYIITQPIASGEMTCPVTVSFMDASGNAVSIIDYAYNSVDTEVRRTVVDYAQRVLDISKNDQQKNLVQALVTYGGYAQIAFNAVDPDNPAYGTTPPSLDSVTADSFTDFSLPEKGSGKGITYDATNANLTSAISLRTFFALNGEALEDYTFYLTYVENRVEKTRALEAYSDDKTGRCFVDIERIPAAYFDYTYTISVKKNNVDMFQIQTSILGYLSEFINDSSTDANSNLAKAMYLYNQAANDFFGK